MISCVENLCVVGQLSFELKQEQVEDVYVFDVMFEVYLEVKIGDLVMVEVECLMMMIGDVEIDCMLDILCKQCVYFYVCGEVGEYGDGGVDIVVKNGDCVMVDFVGKIDDVVFQGGMVEDFLFVFGEGCMLLEFEMVVLGLKVGEQCMFDFKFLDDYYGKDVVGKMVQFMVMMKKIEWLYLLEIDVEFVKLFGIEDGDFMKMCVEIKENFECEVKCCMQLIVKNQVMDVLLKIFEFDVLKVLIEQDQ